MENNGSSHIQSHRIERNLGEQPLAKLMAEHRLKPHDLVAASKEQMTHKMISRAVKGRRLTQNVKYKILNALNKVTDKSYTISELFTY